MALRPMRMAPLELRYPVVEPPTFKVMEELNRLNDYLVSIAPAIAEKYGVARSDKLAIHASISRFKDGRNYLVFDLLSLDYFSYILTTYSSQLLTAGYGVAYTNINEKLKDARMFKVFSEIKAIVDFHVRCKRLTIWQTPITSEKDIMYQFESLYAGLVLLFNNHRSLHM